LRLVQTTNRYINIFWVFFKKADNRGPAFLTKIS